MLVIGLTGATGAGKGLFGTIAAKDFHALHIDTDKTARKVVEPGTPCLNELVEFFGKDILNTDGTLNRPHLGEIVFSDPEKLAALNRITHRYVTQDVREVLQAAEKNGKTVAVVDAPLLFESGEDAICHVTVGVIAPESVRFNRILGRDGITQEAAKKRMANAKPDTFFIQRCDYILENDGSTQAFAEKAKALLQTLLKNT